VCAIVKQCSIITAIPEVRHYCYKGPTAADISITGRRVIALVRTARTIFSATLLVTLASQSIQAQSIPASASKRGIACWNNEPTQIASGELGGLNLAEDVIELTADNADIQTDGDALFSGPIELRGRGRLLKSGQAQYDAEKGLFEATNGIEYRDANNIVSGTEARYDTRSGEFKFTDAEFELRNTPSRGTAEQILLAKSGVLELQSVTYTSCPPGRDDWVLKAREVKLDADKGMGTARGATLRFKNVPIMYVPYFSYPISDDRKTGLLFPSMGTSDRRGVEVIQPFYWNIAPNYDATIAPRFMSKRGVQLGIESRLLLRQHSGEIEGDFLPNDSAANTDRWRYALLTKSMLPGNWRGMLDLKGVSDNNYFEDLASSQSSNSRTNLGRRARFDYNGDIWAMSAMVQDFQIIDDEILPDDEPYLMVPQLTAIGNWNKSLFGLDYRFDSEATYFHREESVSGLRVHIRPEASLPIRNRGFFLTPKLALDHTTYSLRDEDDDAESSPSRTAPIGSVDLGALFERYTGDNDGYIVTLEPRALYTYIPFREQNSLPVFDTIRPDFNLIQLFRQNRFIGYDRLGDTNQLSVGISSRVLSAEDGRELLTATIGQTLFFDGGEVVLPGEIFTDENSTDYIAELGINVWEKWGLDFRYQYDSDTNETSKTSMRVRYQPGPRKAFNVAYRYARESLEQTDFSVAWPIAENWNAIGRYNYSIQDSEALDKFAGVEYNSCCWAISLLARSTVSRNSDISNSSISLQFVLKGFSNIGTKAATELEHDILGGMRF
jgi:LPS-assembly protein